MMTRSFRLAAVVVAVAGLSSCQPPPPTLDLLVATVRPDTDATVTITATNGDGTAGTGLVELSTTLGNLGAGSLTLVEGSARTTVRCSRSTPGCAAGGMLQVTARWTSSSGLITQSATARIVAAIEPNPDAGVVVDAGVRDAGVDAGVSSDAGVVVDAGLVIVDGTPLNLAPGEGLVLGRLGSPRTLGFSPFSSAAVVRVGFDRMPDQAVILSNRLVYVRNGNVWVWQEDDIFPDAGVDAGEVDAGEMDAGELDAGEVDAGELDAGAPDAGMADAGVRDGGADAGVDAGPDTGPFPLFAPEANDPFLATCDGRFGADAGLVRALVTTPAGGLWLGCSRRPDAGIELYANNQLQVTTSEAATPIAANEVMVLALTDDGGLRLFSNNVTPQLQGLTARTFARAARATSSGFEVLAFDPVFNLCTIVSIDLATGTMRDFQLPPPVPAGSSCLDAQFFGQRDALLYVVQPPSAGVQAIPFARSRTDAGIDAGTRDGGADAGVDAGMRVDAGSFSGFFFVEGPPSEFKAMPPTLSIDFSRPVKVVTP